MSRTPPARLLTASITAVAVTSALIAGAVGIAAANEPTPPGPIHTNIIGGSEATEPYPFMASLQLGRDIPFPEGDGAYKKGTHVCGASLISPTWLVTADHCVLGWEANDLQLRVGSLDRFEGGTVVQPKRFISHSEKGDPSYLDFALIELTEPVQQTPVVIGNAAPTGDNVRLLGWGHTCSPEKCTSQPIPPSPTIPDPSEDRATAPLKLRQVDTKILPDDKCTSIKNEAELCVGEVDGARGACYGDSGGPALIEQAGRWVLVGATSRGNQEGCASGPAIYTDVTAVRAWITTVTGVK